MANPNHEAELEGMLQDEADRIMEGIIAHQGSFEELQAKLQGRVNRRRREDVAWWRKHGPKPA